MGIQGKRMPEGPPGRIQGSACPGHFEFLIRGSRLKHVRLCKFSMQARPDVCRWRDMARGFGFVQTRAEVGLLSTDLYIQSNRR